MYQYIQMSDDGHEISNTFMEKDIDAFIKHVKEEIHDMFYDESDPDQSEFCIGLEGCTSLDQIERHCGGFYWGENDTRIIHFVAWNDDFTSSHQDIS